MSELTIEQKIQGVIQALSYWEDADVVINDWSVVDRPNVEAPYVIIETSDDFEWSHIAPTAEMRWGVPIILFEVFHDWDESFNNFRDRRQAILDAFTVAGAAASPGMVIEMIRNDGPITPYYDRMIPQEQQAESLPVFLMQRMILEGREF